MISLNNNQKLVYDELTKLKTHPSAEELYSIVLKKNSKIGIATIYRILDFLQKNNMVIKLDGTTKRYDACVEKHHHIKCTQCGKIEDVDINLDYDLDLLKAKGYKIDFVGILITGICYDCQHKKT